MVASRDYVLSSKKVVSGHKIPDFSLNVLFQAINLENKSQIQHANMRPMVTVVHEHFFLPSQTFRLKSVNCRKHWKMQGIR